MYLVLKEIKCAFSFSYFTKLIINQAENRPENNCFSINQQEEKNNKIIGLYQISVFAKN